MKKVQVVLVAASLALAGVAPARAEHASGGDAPLLIAAIALTGSAVYDIVDAHSSARKYNERALALQPLVDVRSRTYGLRVTYSFGAGRPSPPERPSRSASLGRAPVYDAAPPARPRGPKSPGRALALSLGATVVPVGLGIALASGGDGGEAAGFWLISGGMIVGPAVGHWYAERGGRGAAGVGLRLGLGLGMLKLYGCCT